MVCNKNELGSHNNNLLYALAFHILEVACYYKNAIQIDVFTIQLTSWQG